jgi:uncharacterized protein (DUF697 family)
MPDPVPNHALSKSADAFTAYEENAAGEVELWAEGDASALSKALRLVARPLDWAAERPEAEDIMEKVNEQIVGFLDTLSDASGWTYDEELVLERARDDHGLAAATTLADLRVAPMTKLDDLAHTYFTENAVLSAIEGGGTGLGGVTLLAADVPALFTINLRLIQQIAASYGFPMEGPEARPLVLRIFSAAAADTPEARQDALAELRAAGVAFARGGHLAPGDVGTREQGEGTTTTENQSRVMVNELARNVAAREMAQLVPLAGAATGAGMNYWFTSSTAQTAYMLSRALFLEHRRRQ